ncbi:SDR family NAD(P)-dependent oxidoreductase [Saccharomonospora sp. CUA-673]|uniref:SDR family NAD(P)-dependent oxidoreductase n=1 Tax=Saccharomonospora sp. CUA-673 TaxID=1904969 RepID=UPI0021017214|nr:SDR family NAD(P)-dependent oxidoreductase [Saccharomonospora sp. CUA-673]
MLVSSGDLSADVAGQHRRAIEAAVAAGARRILYTSQQNAAADSPYAPAALHAATEAALAESGVAWTALRNGFFGGLDQLLGPWARTDTIAQPADGPIPWTDRSDLAEAAAVVLAGERTFDGPVTLAAPPATLDDFASALTEATGHPVERVVVDDAQWRADQLAAGVPEVVADMTLALFKTARSGYFADPGTLLEELLGREPRSITQQIMAQLTMR